MPVGCNPIAQLGVAGKIYAVSTYVRITGALTNYLLLI